MSSGETGQCRDEKEFCVLLRLKMCGVKEISQKKKQNYIIMPYSVKRVQEKMLNGK